jgi:CubicO group peptidase (beta-lactamase class C family)
MNAAMRLRWFSGSVLVAKGGKILASKGYGMANYELDVPNGPQTKFRLGSDTKQFTAMAIMQLQEQGKLKAEDPIKKFLPDFPNGETITIHHLLTHTSGIPSFTEFPDYVSTMALPSPVEKTVERFKNKPLEFAPGEKYNYSNSGYILLGYLIEKISGKSYEAFLKENIFDPLQMKDSGYDHSTDVLKNRAAGYELSGGEIYNASYIDMTIPHAGGALYSTVEDLYKWDRALYTEKLVKKSALEKIFTPFKNNYAYGWLIGAFKGHKSISHDGGINGFTTNIARYVNDDACVVVLNNFGTAFTGKISQDLAAILFGEKYELPKKKKIAQVDPKVTDDFIGKYQGPMGLLVVTKEGRRLFVEIEGRQKFEVFPESETRFFLEIAEIEISFVKDDKGKVSQLILHYGGQDIPAKKIE